MDKMCTDFSRNGLKMYTDFIKWTKEMLQFHCKLTKKIVDFTMTGLDVCTDVTIGIRGLGYELIFFKWTKDVRCFQ